MDLAEALDLSRHELVAFVGAGGKKTAMARLVAEGEPRGVAVGYTTTVHVPPPPYPLVISDPSELDERLRAHEPPLAFARDRVDEPARVAAKVRGFEPPVVDAVFEDGPFDWLLVKADGARQREFKAPAASEPPLPRRSTVVVPVASVRAVGEPLAPAAVHRPERVRAITGVEPGAPLTADAVGRVIASDDGGLKHVPPAATVVPLVNKADTPALRETATEVLDRAFAGTDRIRRGIVAALESGVIEVVDAD